MNPTEVICPAFLLYNMGKRAQTFLSVLDALWCPWRPGQTFHPWAPHPWLLLFPAVATASRTSHALQTQAAASPASRAGTGPSATSPAHLAPLARAAGSSVPAAGWERPVRQTLGTVSAATLGGWGPGEGGGLFGVGCPLLQDPHSSSGIAGPSPSRGPPPGQD